MSAVRIAVEWCFKEITQQFSSLDYTRTQKVLLSPIELSYCVAVLFHNAHICLHQPQISQFFLDYTNEQEKVQNDIDIGGLDVTLLDPPQLNEYFHN